MKKLFAVLVALIPVLYVTCMLLVLFYEEDYIPTLLGGIIILGLLFNAAFCALSNKANKKFLATCNLWSLSTNLIVYAAEIIYFIVLVAMSSDIGPSPDMGVGLGIALYIIFCIPHWITYLFTRIFAAINCGIALRNVCSTAVKALHVILHLIPLADLLSAIWVFGRVHRELGTEPAA